MFPLFLQFFFHQIVPLRRAHTKEKRTNELAYQNDELLVKNI